MFILIQVDMINNDHKAQVLMLCMYSYGGMFFVLIWMIQTKATLRARFPSLLLPSHVWNNWQFLSLTINKQKISSTFASSHFSWTFTWMTQIIGAEIKMKLLSLIIHTRYKSDYHRKKSYSTIEHNF